MNQWHIDEDTFNNTALLAQETVFTVGNGYFCTRGAFEEGYPRATPATLLFGVFDAIAVGKEELANAPDWLPLQLFVNGERFRLDLGNVLAYRRTLDLQHGVLSRTVRWESPSGIRMKIAVERFTSLAEEHVGCIRYSVTIEEQSTTTQNGGKDEFDIVLRASLNTAVGNYDLMHWEPVDQGSSGDLLWLRTQARHSPLQLAQSMSFITQAPGFDPEFYDSDVAPSISLRGTLAPGATVTAEKIVVMYTTRDTDDPLQSAVKLHNNLTHGGGYDRILARHKQAWLDYWRIA
ncbi:MAG TPA: hypothetical protein VEL69_04340, partial [Ktedonobacteraceae bacterium]|nr:hypothetical protein [Ktedonobacteraceae bacterium]